MTTVGEAGIAKSDKTPCLELKKPLQLERALA
jgi:hypothetical protein